VEWAGHLRRGSPPLLGCDVRKEVETKLGRRRRGEGQLGINQRGKIRPAPAGTPKDPFITISTLRFARWCRWDLCFCNVQAKKFADHADACATTFQSTFQSNAWHFRCSYETQSRRT
jgi:hypothetical protein